jgi:hypothetical protein
VFTIGGKQYITVGLDDGSIHVYDFSDSQSKGSHERPIFKVTKGNKDDAKEVLPHPDDIYCENLYEHSDSITAIEKNFAY